MNAILIKLFATALTLSQVTTRPDAVKTAFDPAKDAGEVVQILRDGCAGMRRAFDIEDINLDDLISTAMEDPKAVAGDSRILQGLDFGELVASYKQFCKNETVQNSPFVAADVIAFYNKAAADLPDVAKLREKGLPGATTILDGRGERFTEAFEAGGRRLPVAIARIPPLVQRAFVAAEDKRFESHKGIDERGVIRAFIGNLAKPGRPAGGSTITQQVVKNLLVGDDVTYERKIREMIVASRLERAMTKPEILELYLNAIYLGRGAYGIEMAARSYFGKSASALTLSETALLAGMPKGPGFYSPDRYPERARERTAYVLARLKEDGAITAEEMTRALAEPLRLVPQERLRRETGLYFVDHVGREARTLAGLETLTGAPYTIRSTINAGLQSAVEGALQEGLAAYELSNGRQRLEAPEANLAEAVRKIEAGPKPEEPNPKPAWRRALEAARAPLYDVRWPLAVVLDKGGGGVRVGLADGRVATLNAWNAATRAKLQPYDVVHVRLRDERGKALKADLRVRPAVQGAAVVLENRTGRILAMTGGFSYPASQLNRVTQAVRQPGSTFKPLTYLAALGHGLQPNTLVLDTPVTLPPIGGTGDSWSPRNADRSSAGITTLRRALEHSKNLVTARLLDGGIEERPAASLKRVCELALEAQLYAECEPYYPFVLGAQPVRMIDLAAFYAAIANEGARPAPHALEEIRQGERVIYRREARAPVMIGSADRVAFYQLKTMLQGVVQRGTAASLARVSPYVAGKTGTTDGEADAWFVGFTNDVTIAVWVGYDNADGTRRTLGRGATGGRVAVPIFEAILKAAFANGIPRVPLSPPTPETSPLIADLPIDLRSGSRVGAGRQAFLEHFRLDRSGRLDDTQYRLVPRETLETSPFDDGRDGDLAGGVDALDPWASNTDPRRTPDGDPPRQPSWRGPTAQVPWWEEDGSRQRSQPRRRDPDYLWGDDRFN